MIHRCALAVIAKRGLDVVGPTLSPVDEQEEDFLHRHVARLREVVHTNNARGRFRSGSILQAELHDLMRAGDSEFLDIAQKLVGALVNAMQGTNNAAACVVALLVEGPESGPEVVSLLKLDAEVEAAQLRQSDGVVRLRIFQDLLPRPGDIQKGFSWPDHRPLSELFVLDKVVAGSAVKYFQNAFGIDVSPKSKDTEEALVRELEALPPDQIAPAIAAVGDGGNAEDVVERIRHVAPTFDPRSVELGSEGGLGGRIRPNFGGVAKKTFLADDIELRVPLAALRDVSTRREGGRYVTTIVTDTPLTPPMDD